MRKMVALGGIVAVIAAIVLIAQTAFSSDAKSEAREVRWLVSHTPVDAFARATDVFARSLSEKSGGTLKLVVVKPEDLGIDTKGDVPHAEIMRLMKEAKIDVGTAYTVALAKESPAFEELGSPFRFDSYESVSAFVDGAEGQSILSTLPSARALAFTMSGGFRVFASATKSIESVEDIRGLRVGTSGGTIAEDTLRKLGAIPVSLDLESGPVDPSSLDALETTFARLSAILSSDSPFLSHVSETNHSVFLTATIVDNEFFNSLTQEEQRALTDAAREAAAVEREDSEALNRKTKEALEGRGSIVTGLTDEARASFVRATAPTE